MFIQIIARPLKLITEMRATDKKASSNAHVLESVDNVGSYLAEKGDRFLIQSLRIANIAPNNALEGELGSFCQLLLSVRVIRGESGVEE